MFHMLCLLLKLFCIHTACFFFKVNMKSKDLGCFKRVAGLIVNELTLH